MIQNIDRPSNALAVSALPGLLMWPAIGAAWVFSGQGRAVQATADGVTTVLAHTGTLDRGDDARGAFKPTGTVSSLGTVDTRHATTISSVWGWDSGDYVASAASLGEVDLSIAGNDIRADAIMAEALVPVSGSNYGTTMIPGLNGNGLSVDVAGEPNPTVPLVVGVIEDPGGYNDPVHGRDLETPGPRSATAIQS